MDRILDKTNNTERLIHMIPTLKLIDCSIFYQRSPFLSVITTQNNSSSRQNYKKNVSQSFNQSNGYLRCN